MNSYYKDTCGRLREIFAEHCNLSMEQYEEISRRFVEREADIQEEEPLNDIDTEINDMCVIFEFLYNTKELNEKEYNELVDLANVMRADAYRMVRERVEG